jgi:hypothetical protein
MSGYSSNKECLQLFASSNAKSSSNIASYVCRQAEKNVETGNSTYDILMAASPVSPEFARLIESPVDRK